MSRELRKETANKGFSLVELIIVVAIMAVLIGVLAPQYMKYVERSRNSTDNSNCTALENALMVWGSETDIPAGETAFVADAGGSSITVTRAAVPDIAGTNAAAIQSALDNAGIDTTNLFCESQTAWTQYVITVTVATDGVVTISHTYS